MSLPISSDDIKAIRKTSEKGLKAAKAISGSIGKTSVTRLAKDTIMQVPLILSSDIPTDESIAIARADEKFYASAMVSVFSLRTVDLSQNDDIAQYIKRFHNNSDIPANIKAASNFVFESANILNDQSLQATETDILSCWNNVSEQVNMSSLNDIYKPYEKTKRIISDKIQTLQIANESVANKIGKGTTIDGILDKARDFGQNDSFKGINPSKEHSKENKNDSKGNNQNKEVFKSGSTVIPQKFNELVKNDKLTSLEPTMMNIQFVVHGGDGDNKQFVQNVVLGVKAMIRSVRSDLMVSNMVEASKNSNGIFKFIKWTKGEYKFVKDFIFNLSEIKEAAISNRTDKNFIKSLLRRKAINNVSKFFDNRIPPSTIICMTSYEVARVAEVTGVNLSEAHNALNLLNKYYLVGFQIYDTETKILSSMFDGDEDFAETTIEALKNNTGKNSDKISMNDAMKMFGRV